MSTGLIIGICLVVIALLIIVFGEPTEFTVFIFFAGIIVTAVSLLPGREILSEDERNTEIIRRYQKGDYQLELKVDGDKVDTLYIFK